MPVDRRRRCALVLAAAALSLAASAGCGSRPLPAPAPQPAVPVVTPAPAPEIPQEQPEPVRPEPAQVENWEAFANSTRALREEIARKDSALRASGGAASPVELASLRLVAEAWSLIADGQSERATDLLERAIALDGRNGFAYLFVAYAYHRMARFEQGALFLERADRYLPPEAEVLGELEGLRRSILLNSGAGAGF